MLTKSKKLISCKMQIFTAVLSKLILLHLCRDGFRQPMCIHEHVDSVFWIKSVGAFISITSAL